MGSEQKVNLAAIIKNPSNDTVFLLTRQTPPPKYDDPEYDSFQDSDLWDLPSAQLSPVDDRFTGSFKVQIDAEEDSVLELLERFDLDSAIAQILRKVGIEKSNSIKWRLSKAVEEPNFGPGKPVKTVYINGEFEPHDLKLEDHCKWMAAKDLTDLLLEVKPHNDRVGPLVVIGLLNDVMQSSNFIDISSTLRFQEYPPGVKIVPMKSRTSKPFQTTNLVLFVPETKHDGFVHDSFIATGDALIIDPGCNNAGHKELEELITALPRNLVVFVTHHHYDHVEGLSIIQKCNPNATLLAHENTFRRIRKDDWSLGYIQVNGSEEICIGGQLLKLISAPGHTDGHMALLHVTTNSLIVGDHCVGQGSAVLDISSGGNMSDYFDTTYKFIDLSPNVLIPMHGRVNMYPKHMLCGYLKNRRNRESTVLKAIEDGAKTLFDIVAHTYADVDRSLWLHASSNVRLHVEHLAQQNKLPSDFSIENFNSSVDKFSGHMSKV